MAGGNIVDEVKQIDSDGNIAKIDGVTGSIYTIPLEHGYIHQGKAFTLSYDVVIPKNDFSDVLFITPAVTSIHLMAHKVVTTTSPGEVCVYEAVTVSASGSPITPYNADRSSASESTVLIYKIPTVSGLGTMIDCDPITGTKLEGGGTTDVDFEWILKPNTHYLFRYSNASGIPTDANFSLFYLEV